MKVKVQGMGIRLQSSGLINFLKAMRKSAFLFNSLLQYNPVRLSDICVSAVRQLVFHAGFQLDFLLIKKC